MLHQEGNPQSFSFFSLSDKPSWSQWKCSADVYQLHRKTNPRRRRLGVCPGFVLMCFLLENNLTPPRLPSSSWTSWSGSLRTPWRWGFRTWADHRKAGVLPVVQLNHVSKQHQLHWESAVSENDLGYRKHLLLLITTQKGMRRNLSYRSREFLKCIRKTC